MGAHTLLYFSHYSSAEMQEIWASLDRPAGATAPPLQDLVARPVAGILLGEDAVGLPCSETHVVCTQTGRTYDVTPEQRVLLTACDGQQHLGGLVEHWARTNAAGLIEEIAFTARAFSAAADLLHKGLLVASE